MRKENKGKKKKKYGDSHYSVFSWYLRTCNHSHKLVAIICMSPSLARAPCFVSSRSLLFRKMKCICAVTKRRRAAGVIARTGPLEATSAPICKPVKTREPAPKPTAPSRRQKLPYCCACRVKVLSFIGLVRFSHRKKKKKKGVFN